ncbi:hypothetical protein DF047_35470 [Burkholderia cenocepacia]|uniref:hypothetical protein n=1 Tax=Burkholderia cenocepacia TaxID=95486 RepID=UPI000F5C014C|nr:hypothetical protein [Burkholderia cenocepacia]RQU99202.1 hypothetical protein DF047_35470 [Burkholderia cenocepacia]
MNPNIHLSQHGEAFDDALLDTPDGPETMVLTAIRTWQRSHCAGQRARLDWNRMLTEAGLRSESIERFDLVMRVLARASARPFETFCRCATTLTSDEATLLQAIALLQRTKSAAAVALLGEWRAQSFVSELLKLIRWLAIDLLDAGIELRVRERDTTYMH